MGPPLAYLLTWTCHGTWLHGDPRGSFERLPDGGGAFVTPDAERRRKAAAKTRSEPIRLNAAKRKAATDAIVQVCRRRAWTLLACDVRSNHAHVVIGAHDRPEPMMQQLKAWCTRAIRERGHPGPVWTRHGSTKYLWDQESLSRAVRYVRDGQTGVIVVAREQAERQSRAHARGCDENQDH